MIEKHKGQNAKNKHIDGDKLIHAYGEHVCFYVMRERIQIIEHKAV